MKEVSAVAYPNPFTGSINISLIHLESNQPLSVKVLNLQGQVLAEENYNSIESKSLNTEHGAHLAKGVYLLEITNGSHTQGQKIIKE